MSLSEQAQNLLNLIPETGSIGNVTLRKKLWNNRAEFVDENYSVNTFFEAKDELLAAGLIKLGRGKGGSVKRASSVTEQIPATAKVFAGEAYPVTEQPSTPEPISDSIAGPEEF